VTAGLAEATDTTEDDEWDVGAPLAGWWQRAGAFAIDVLVGLGALSTLLLVGWSAPRGGWLWWVMMVLAAAVLIAVAVNRYILPTTTGWSLGRAVTGIEVVDRDGGPVTPWRLLLRDLAHVVDTIPFCLGWFWPLLDSRARTFADMIARTEVHQVPGDQQDRRALAARVIGAATALALLAAVLGYALVYRHQKALDKARDTIAEDGPTLVTDMLSYTVKTADDDFTRSQGLVTEAYRPELVQQQEAVKKNGLVDNTYWVSNSAVLSSSEDRAAMLLLLQGQRGSGATQRFVTASVRAEYESHGDRWLVSNLTVLTAPKPAPAPAESTAPDKPAPDKPAPDKPAPDKPAPAKPAPDKPAPAKPAPDKPAPAKPAPPTPSAGGR
jgi:Mce-associated membrane protein